MIAKHVLNIHMNRHQDGMEENEVEGELPLEKMKRYVAYCRR